MFTQTYYRLLINTISLLPGQFSQVDLALVGNISSSINMVRIL